MSWLEFISSMTNALAWPLIVAIVLFGFRRAITRLLPDLRRLKAGPTGVEMEWERKLEEVREELKAAPMTDEEVRARIEKEAANVLAFEQTSGGFLREIEDLAKVSPTAAVLEAYRRLEAVLRRAIRERHPDIPDRDVTLTSRLIKLAIDDGLIRPQENAALQDLRILRNRLAHGAETRSIDYGQAMEYAELVRQLIIHIELASGRTIDDWQGPGAPPYLP
jgi:hypothetical protein